MQVLQHGADGIAQGLVVLGDDDGVVADAVGGVLLQQHVAQAHEFYLPVGVGVVGEHPHIGVVPGDELLQDHMAGIAGGVHLVQGGEQFLPRLADVDLFQFVVAGGPVGHAIGGLGDVGRAPGEGEVVAHGAVVHEGGRVVDAVLVTQGVELLLVGEHVQHLAGDIIAPGVGGELVLQVGGQLHIAVAAADDQHRLARALGAHLLHVAQEGVRVLVVRAGAVVDDGAVRAGKRDIFAVGDGLDAVGLVKGPGDAVDVDVAAEEQRLEGRCRHGRSVSFISLPGALPPRARIPARRGHARTGGQDTQPPARWTKMTPGIWDSLLITDVSSFRSFTVSSRAMRA